MTNTPEGIIKHILSGNRLIKDRSSKNKENSTRQWIDAPGRAYVQWMGPGNPAWERANGNPHFGQIPADIPNRRSISGYNEEIRQRKINQMNAPMNPQKRERLIDQGITTIPDGSIKEHRISPSPYDTGYKPGRGPNGELPSGYLKWGQTHNKPILKGNNEIANQRFTTMPVNIGMKYSKDGQLKPIQVKRDIYGNVVKGNQQQFRISNKLKL